MHALVFRVRFTTVPCLMMRSNSKQPFWLTGDMMSTLAVAALGLAMVMGLEMVMGLAGVCWPSSVAAMLAVGVTFTICGGSGLVRVNDDYRGVAVLERACYIPDCYGRSTDGRREDRGNAWGATAPATREQRTGYKRIVTSASWVMRSNRRTNRAIRAIAAEYEEAEREP